ncbi:hypothetical protein N4P55_16815 [Pseudomonas fluorescens]|uniref:hypothetical protein n=1 Tax=Pseudomonas fluorescens TaxID=294 RepID=UPI0021D185EF|nr:hypothetical protein [Pseudomonas fluorescens]UXV17554.1 hypothetical protein N4P55_16815 [Pseudomonas fluorescens]
MPEEKRIPDETWSANEELFNCDSLGELLDENDDLEIGATVWKGEKFPVNIAGYVDVGDVIEMLGERAYDDVGEFAEDWPDVPDEARQELDALLSAWISKHCTATFYCVRNVVEYQITAEDMADRVTS